MRKESGAVVVVVVFVVMLVVLGGLKIRDIVNRHNATVEQEEPK